MIDWVGEGMGGRLGESPRPRVLDLRGQPGGDRVFDLASLTKILSTSALLVETCIESGESWPQFLSRKISDVIPEFRSSALADLHIHEVWEHRSGLEAHRLVFDPPRKGPSKRDEAWKCVTDLLSKASISSPAITVYSDLGYLILGLYLERLRKADLREQFEAWKKKRGLAPNGLVYGPVAEAVATETRHPAGEVNDDNARALGGVAPHAGLFGRCEDVWAWLENVLEWSRQEARVAEWLAPPLSGEGSERRFFLGWDRPQGADSTAGAFAPSGTLGHLGWTGTSMWWHPPTKRAAILLTSRVHPSHTVESQGQMRKLRQEFHSRFWQGKLYEGGPWNLLL